MSFKIAVSIFALVSLTVAHRHRYVENDGQAGYRFDYRVNDPNTRDVKSQREERNGDRVTGEYRLRESDGTTRIVRYRAGPQSGFEAEVERQGEARHPTSGQRHSNGGFITGNLGGQSNYHSHYDRGYGHQEDSGNDGGTSHIGTIRWTNQGEGHY